LAGQGFIERFEIMAIDRPDIGEAHIVEHRGRDEGGFDIVL
jgi:hypothetical protein